MNNLFTEDYFDASEAYWNTAITAIEQIFDLGEVKLSLWSRITSPIGKFVLETIREFGILPLSRNDHD